MAKIFSFLFLSFVCFVHAQKYFVKLEVSEKKISLGGEIVLTVKSNVEGEISIEFPPEFIRGYEVMTGMEQEVDYNSGMVNTINYYSQNGSFSKNGTFTVGPAYVKRGKNLYKSNTIEVKVQKEEVDNTNGTIGSKQLKQLAFGVIEANKSSIYEGEPLLLEAKVYSKFRPTSIEDYQSYKIEQSTDKHSLGNTQQLTAKLENIKGTSLYVLNYDRNLIFPSGAGTIQINPFKLVLRQNFDGLALVSTGTSINVKSLPENAPKSFIGMVGELEAACKYSGTCAKKGDMVHIELVLTGKGNLHNIEAPKLTLSKGLILYGKPAVTEEYSFTAAGAEGKVIFDYQVQSTNASKKEIAPIKISYFNPAKESYATITLDGFSSKETEIDQSVHKKGSTTIVKNNKKEQAYPKSLTNSSFVAIAIFSAAALLFLASIAFFFLRRKANVLNTETKETSLPKDTVIVNIENLNTQFSEAVSNQNLKEIESLIFQYLSMSFFQNSNSSREQILDKINADSANEKIGLHQWYNAVQQVKYGLQYEGKNSEELVKESTIIFDRIKNHYKIG